MGTNYYTKTKECETCGHQPEGIHLGKSSAGWQFSFQLNGKKYYKNIEEMREWLKSKTIEDEYCSKVSHKEFWDMVETKQKKKFKNHAEYCHENHPECRDTEEYIIEGYSFSDCEFS